MTETDLGNTLREEDFTGDIEMKNKSKALLILAMDMGTAMLHSGGEIYRVEDTITHILKAYEIDYYDVYTLSNGIFASANESSEDSFSMVCNVPLSSVTTDLGKIAALNQLARDICDKKCSIEEARKRLDACNQSAGYPPLILALACGIGSAGFSYLFGGTPLDAFFAMLIGIVEQCLLLAFTQYHMSRVLKNLFLSMVIAAMSILFLSMGIPIHRDMVVIGAIMPLVPGIAFTTSIREIYNGDYLSGAIHLIDALLTAVCIAVGICLPFYFQGGFL